MTATTRPGRGILLEAAGADVELFEALPTSAWDEYIAPRLEVARGLSDPARDEPRAVADFDAYEAGLLAERPDGPIAYYGTFIARRADRAT